MLRTNFALIFSCLASFAGSPALAQSQNYDVRPQANQVTGDALTTVFKGLTHEGAYNFDAQGRPGIRFTERHYSDGRIIYTEPGHSLKGQWAVTPGDTICYSYESEIIGGGCFRVYQLGSCYYFYSSSFIAREDEVDQDYWTARSVKKGDHATCEGLVS